MNDPTSISLLGMALKKLRQIVTVFKQDWRRVLPFLLIVTAGIIVVAMLFSGGIAKGDRISEWPAKGGLFSLVNNLWPYLVVTQDHSLEVFKGLQFYRFFGTGETGSGETGTAFLAAPLYFIFWAFLLYLIARIRTGRLITGVVRLPVRLVRSLAMKEQGSPSYGIALALLLSFLVLNPITIILLALWAYLSLSNTHGSGLMFFFSVAKADWYRLRGIGHMKPQITSSVGGFVTGMLIAVAAVLFTWFLCDYRMWSRIVFLLLPAGLLFLGPFITHIIKKDSSAKDPVKDDQRNEGAEI